MAEAVVHSNTTELAACADLCELMAAAFAWPTPELAEGLASGAFEADARACLEELGLFDGQTGTADKRGTDLLSVPLLSGTVPLLSAVCPATSLQELRREYSRLFLSPGNLVLIYPYESAFDFAAHGTEGTPTLFANHITAEVERHMREADMLPEGYRREPVDHLATECAFLARMLAAALAALMANNKELAGQWYLRAQSFAREHVFNWAPAFFERVRAEAKLKVYVHLAEFGLAAVGLLGVTAGVTGGEVPCYSVGLLKERLAKIT